MEWTRVRKGVQILIVVGTVSLAARRSVASPPVAPTDALAPEQQRAKFKLPPGFEIQLVASDPDIRKPMNIAFDAKGRLWVTDTVEYPWPAKPGQTPRDTVKILSDFGDDGRARKITTFADALNIPLGVLPLNAPDGRDAAIVYSIPEVRRLVDTDGDGKADRRDTLLSKFASDDTHGMTNNFTRGFDGWVYANHGFKNVSTVKSLDGSEITMSSGNTYRFTPDGKRIEYVAHGQVNPFGLCFDARGDLYSADCHSRPQYLLLPGAYYPSFGKPHDGLGFGPEMCTHDHGSTAIAGTLCYAAEQFPPAYRGNLFNGNPVTNAVNRDRLDWTGSSPKAVEQPDLLSCDDPWFRPVQVALGPDGAVYIADFYNKIIGHYEVDLKHPGRDRTRGRIWRLVYKGDAAVAPPPRMPDLTKASPDELVALLADPNLTVRMLATHRLADVVGPVASDALHFAFANPTNAFQRVHAMWALHRGAGDGLRLDEFRVGASDPDPLVRVHAMRVIADSTEWRGMLIAIAESGLADRDAFVRRATADAFARQPERSQVLALVNAQQEAADAGDTHLAHAVKIALRNRLATSETMAQMRPNKWGGHRGRAVAAAMAGVPTPEAASFLLEQMGWADLPPSDPELLVRHVARHAPPEQVDRLATLVPARFPGDVALQLTLVKAIREALQQRGATPGQPLQELARALASRAIAEATTAPGPKPATGWTCLQPDAATPDPYGVWGTKALASADGRKGEPFFTSLSRGEAYVGVMRTAPFPAPPRLSLYVAGQSGAPPQTEPAKSVVRLRAEGTNEVLVEVPVPRNDVAQRVTWDLKPYAGRRVYVEAADQDARRMWAWVAVGRFDPPVATVPPPAFGAAPADRKRLETAVEIAGSMKVAELQEPLRELLAMRSADAAVRAAAAKALATIDPAAAATPLALLVADPATPASVRTAAAQALGGANSDAARLALVASLAAAPRAGQDAIALALAATPAGAGALLDAVAQGKASPRLLQEKGVRDRLTVSNPPKLDERLKSLTKGLITADEAVQKLIDRRRASFDPAAASAARGKLVFQKNCAACHRIENEGAQVGPQLDGVGKRGHERIIEDVLDPSRNVDAAFRTSLLTLADGDVQSGLFRREEGEALVFADGQGKEFSVPKSQVRRRVESPLSPMPGNFGDVIPAGEFNDLMAYLLGR